MPGDPAVRDMLEIAASTGPLLERARGLVDSLNHRLPVEAIWLTLSDPDSNDYATVGSAGLERSVHDYLDDPTVAQEIQLAELNRSRPPVSVTELPVPVDELPTWADCLIPAGFPGGLGVPLFEAGGPYLGMLSLLFSSGAPPSTALRDRVGAIGSVVARGVSPLRSLLTTARLVRGATSGAVLLANGMTYTLPGLTDHPLLSAGSQVVGVARQTLLAGQVYGSFMWPTHEDRHGTDHVRMTVLAATDVPAFVLGTLLLTPDADCRGLTPRELQILGLLVDGRSNQQIARQLTIAPRTAAAHVEHILHKLDTQTRTLAAVRAAREGCYVPSPV